MIAMITKQSVDTAGQGAGGQDSGGEHQGGRHRHGDQETEEQAEGLKHQSVSQSMVWSILYDDYQ